MNERIITLDWTELAIGAMLLFGIIGLRNGWQRGLVTLVSLFFAWGVAIRATDFLIRAIKFLLDLDFSGDQRGFFQIMLYIASVVMVVVTFNSRVINSVPRDRRDRLSGVSTGLLSGYFFIVLLLDLGREWLATHVESWDFLYRSSIALDGDARTTEITILFTNNPYVAYEQLITAQSLILLFLLLVFWHGLLFALLGRADRALRAQ
jgi:hypothetical protein